CLGPATVQADGQELACTRFSLNYKDPFRQELLWIGETHELLKLVQPATGLSFQRASDKEAHQMASRLKEPEKTADRPSGAQERSQLTFLKVEVLIEAPGLTSVESLNTPAQTFIGELKDGRVKGIFKLRADYLPHMRDLGISATAEERDQPDPALQPAPGIESDAEEIRKKAQFLTENLCLRSHAVHALSVWVHQQIILRPDAGETALETLQKGEADALGAARLCVALCRSLEIPARVVMGGLCNRFLEDPPRLDPHFWCEVHMGSEGWVPLDPALGQLTFIDAGHLKLNGASPFTVNELKVLDYIPKPESLRIEVPCKEGDFPLPIDKVFVFDYYQDELLWGTEKVVFKGTEAVKPSSGNRLYLFSSEVALKDFEAKTLTRAYANGRFHSYEVEAGDFRLSCRAEGAQIVCLQSKDGDSSSRRVAMPKEGLFFDSRQVLHLGFMLSRLDLIPGETLQVPVFRPAVSRVMPLQVEYRGVEEAVVGNRSREVRVFQILGAGQEMHILLDEQGLLLEEVEQGGRIRVTLRGVED
ncbi:MAG: transglutaminase domain-containing protein, partial [Planctomycetes bacterium]|nr:transglutaminase domain-containing protein [Planctomycetota bacterium]